jgi:hypothetical protein
VAPKTSASSDGLTRASYCAGFRDARELEAHRREDLVLEIGLARELNRVGAAVSTSAGALLDRGRMVQRPSPESRRVTEFLERRILDQRRGGEVSSGRHDAAAPPDLGDRAG